MAASRIVVLGATGFIARALAVFFEAQGQPFRAIGSREVDLADASAAGRLQAILRPADVLVVCSALTPEKGRDRATFLKNVRMIDSVCAALAAAPCAQVVYISSDSVSVDSTDLYALAHLVRENLLQAACGEAIPLAILRAGAVYGVGDTHNAYGPNRFLRTARAQRTIALFGEGEERRDHLYIRDLARIVHLCIEKRTAGILPIATGAALTFREIADSISGALGGGIAIESLPRTVPVVHRHADPSLVEAAFPGFRGTPFDTAIAEMIADRSEPPPLPAPALKARPKPRILSPVESALDVTLMIPCLNEERNIAPTLDQVFAAMHELPYTFEVLVIDDGSTDRTSAVVEEYAAAHPDLPLRLMRHAANRGLTRTYVDGAFQGRGTYYRQVCGDNVEDKSVLLASLGPLGEADMIIPYRERTPGKSAFREWLSRFYTHLINLLSGYNIRYYNGQATHLRYNVMRWGPYSFGFGFQAELITRLLDEGATYIEVAVGGTHTNKEGKNSALNLKNFLSVGHTLLETLIRRVRKRTFHK